MRSETEDPDLPRFDDWLECADRLILAAINARNSGNQERGNKLMATARRIWDGKGLRDEVYRANKHHTTYHTALYYQVTRDSEAIQVLKSLQQLDPKSNRYGGVYTEYGKDGKPLSGTDTNVKTTAATLRALNKVVSGPWSAYYRRDQAVLPAD